MKNKTKPTPCCGDTYIPLIPALGSNSLRLTRYTERVPGQASKLTKRNPVLKIRRKIKE